MWLTRLTSTCNFDTQPFAPAPDLVMAMQSSPTHRTTSEISRSDHDEMHEYTKTEQHQPQRSGKQHVADTRGDTERANWWDTTHEACQIFGARDRTTQTTPGRTSKLMDPRAALVRRPTSTYKHSRRFVRITMIRHASPLAPARETVFDNGRKTRAHVNHMVGNCLCAAPHKHNRVSNDLHPLTQRHIMKTNDRQSSRTLTHGPRNHDHIRTCRKIRIDNSLNWCRPWSTVRCADTADAYDTTHILRFVSIGQFHVPLSPRRSGAVTYPHCPKEKQHATRQQKHKTCQHTRTHNKQAAICHHRTMSM